jgi:hypothetical protein
MMMLQLVNLIKWEAFLFLGGLAAIVAVQLLTGQINTDGLFRGEDGEEFSPARVQLMVSTLGAAFYYLSQVLANQTPGSFPPVPQTWPILLGGSNLIYLGGKAYARWFGQKNTK